MSQLESFYKMLQRAAASGNGAVNTLLNCRNHTVYVKWSVGCSAGVVEIESAPDKDYAGTWAPVTTIAWSAADKVDQWRGTGAFGAIRTRESTAITGGTVTTEYFAN